MTNNIGKLTIYKESDPNKQKYLDTLNIGDLLFFHENSKNHNTPLIKNSYPGHVGIYIGEQKFIHSSPKEGKVIISKINNDYLKTLVATRNLLKGILPHYQ